MHEHNIAFANLQRHAVHYWWTHNCYIRTCRVVDVTRYPHGDWIASWRHMHRTSNYATPLMTIMQLWHCDRNRAWHHVMRCENDECRIGCCHLLPTHVKIIPPWKISRRSLSAKNFFQWNYYFLPAFFFYLVSWMRSALSFSIKYVFFFQTTSLITVFDPFL